MVTGSVAKGIADYYSDIDNGGFLRGGTAGRRDPGSDPRRAGQPAAQLIHATAAAWEATMAEVLTELKVDTPLHFTPFQFKRASSFAEQLLLAPPQLAARIDSLFHSPLSTALPELENPLRGAFRGGAPVSFGFLLRFGEAKS
jgi:hypothetical protein